MFNPIRIDARNPGPMTGAGNATYLLAAPGFPALLVDAGVGHAEHIADLRTALERADATLDTVFVTHGHGDHAGGAVALAAAFPGVRFLKHPWPAQDHEFDVPWQRVGEGDRIAAADETLQVIATPGHSPDHLALWHEPSRTLFTGDLVVAGSTVMIHASRGGDLRQYLQSLERMLSLEPSQLLPAHGAAIGDPATLLRMYIDHRLLRERQVLAALAHGHGGLPAIAESIYHGLAPALMPAALETVRAHLEKLRQDGRVTEEQERWHRVR